MNEYERQIAKLSDDELKALHLEAAGPLPYGVDPDVHDLQVEKIEDEADRRGTYSDETFMKELVKIAVGSAKASMKDAAEKAFLHGDTELANECSSDLNMFESGVVIFEGLIEDIEKAQNGESR